MSNTSSVTPYSGGDSTVVAASGAAVASSCFATLGAAAVHVGQWILEQSPEEKAYHAEQRAKEMRELALGCPTQRMAVEASRMSISSLSLSVTNRESFLESAQKLGFRMTSKIASVRDASTSSVYLLQGSRGERLAVEQSVQGRLTVHAAGSLRSAQRLVRQHTVDCALRHFAAKGMQVQTQQLANGEVEIRAQETQFTRGGQDKATVQATVHNDGTTFVDVDRIKGHRCEQIVSEFAQAVGGQVTGTKKKDAFFQLPGEPAKVQQNI